MRKGPAANAEIQDRSILTCPAFLSPAAISVSSPHQSQFDSPTLTPEERVTQAEGHERVRGIGAGRAHADEQRT